MGFYMLRRLLFIPVTLFFILLVNFVIINMAPGEPTNVSGAAQGDVREAKMGGDFDRDDQYLFFREHYGLTLPLLFNAWPQIGREVVRKSLGRLVTRRAHPDDAEEMASKRYNRLRLKFGDQARFVMRHLLAIAGDSDEPFLVRQMALRFFVRAGTLAGHVGPNLTPAEKEANRAIAKDNRFLRSLLIYAEEPSEKAVRRLDKRVRLANEWYAAHRDSHRLEPTLAQRAGIFFRETRVMRYFSRVLTLDFGTLRTDPNRAVVREVFSRIKVSLILAVLPMLLTFCLCQLFGCLMALKQGRWPDVSLNVVFLILYAVPIFVVAPFLIEKIALPHKVPFTEMPIPISGLHSPDSAFAKMTSLERLGDIGLHVFLPLVAVMYGMLAVQSRLSRTAVLEVLRQDYIRTAQAKGLPRGAILFRHVGRNAAITVVTSLAASLGVILGGSLIVETIFGIDGFGRFFYEAIVDRDYNVIMFSTFAGSSLALLGYVGADLTYCALDPRISLE